MPNAPLLAAAVAIRTPVKVGEPTAGHTGARVKHVHSDFETVITLLECDGLRVCLLASHLGTSVDQLTDTIRTALADALAMPESNVLAASSHNHSVPLLDVEPYNGWVAKRVPPKLTRIGERFIRDIRAAARTLPCKLQPVTVWHGLGREGRINYNRKGRRADGSTYFMREEDRQLVGSDFRGDADDDAPVICLRGADGKTVTWIIHYNAHPVTMYRAEDFIASGDWPQIACERVGAKLGPRGVPVSFLQGCAGDVNSRHQFSGDTKLAAQYGRWLADACIGAARAMKRSESRGMGFNIGIAKVPFASLPPLRSLEREKADMESFVARAEAGDEDTLRCAGLNFPRAMSPAYRGMLVSYVLEWTRWAIERHRRGNPNRGLPRTLDLEIHALRLGDVGLTFMPTEPFQGIGRQVRAASPMPLTIPVAYTNSVTGFIGYVPDASNIGDGEYMSSFYRYTRYLPPFRKPAGDVMARVGVKLLDGLWREATRPARPRR